MKNIWLSGKVGVKYTDHIIRMKGTCRRREWRGGSIQWKIEEREMHMKPWVYFWYLHCMLREASLTREYPEVLFVAMQEKMPESSSRVTLRMCRWLPSWNRRLVGTRGLLLWAQLNTMWWRFETSHLSKTSEPSITSISSGLELK